MRTLTFALSFILAAVPVLAQAAPRNARGNAELKRYCTSDAITFCDGIDPHSKAMNACFRKHRAELSAGCRRAIDSYQARSGDSLRI